MPQESLTWKFFRNGAQSYKIESVDDFARIIDSWMADPRSYASYQAAFLQLRYEEDPTVVIDELVKLAAEVNGSKLSRHPFPPRQSL